LGIREQRFSALPLLKRGIEQVWTGMGSRTTERLRLQNTPAERTTSPGAFIVTVGPQHDAMSAGGL
jgi:hypothetical protein